jgi:DNA helicase-2/ATP-dependent DNA helicase PcrA
MVNSLSKNQEIAINSIDGSFIISAGPGSGKTFVIIERIKKIIDNKLAPPEKILAITFTNRASKEMKNRLSENKYKGVRFSTIHSLALTELRNKREYKYNIIDDEDSERIFKKIVESDNIYNNCDLEILYNKFMALRCIRSDKRRNLADGGINEIIAKYISYLRSNKVTDFDLILEDYEKLTEDNGYIYDFSDTFKYIFVDEYQDTNDIQYKIIRNITSNIKNICFVGDLDQSIYLWRGASGEIISDTISDYHNISVLYLNDNFRSDKNIVKFCNDIILSSSNPLRVNMNSNKSSEGKLLVKKFINKHHEINWIANEIIQKNLGNCAILLRVNYQIADFELIFKSLGINYNIVGGVSLYKRKVIKIIISYLKIATNKNDYVSFIYSFTNPKRGLGEKGIAKIEEKYPIFNYNQYTSELVKNKNKYVSNYLIVIDNIVNLLLDKKYKEAIFLISDVCFKESSLLESEKELINKFTTYFEEQSDQNIIDILDKIYLDKEEYDIDKSSITIATIHSSKGKEYDSVFIPFLVDGNIPWYKSTNNEKNLEEELRIFYVASSRAKSKLILSYYKEDRGNIMKKSRFLANINECKNFKKIDNFNIGDKVIIENDECIIIRIFKELDETYFEVLSNGINKTYSKKYTDITIINEK